LRAVLPSASEKALQSGAGELAPKTVNNTLTTLVVALNTAVKEKRIVLNPALEVPKLPAAHVERDSLRLHEIPLYLDSASDLYRPLAETLIGSGVRISSAIALQLGDLELDEAGGLIVVYRSRKKGKKIGSTKSDRFDTVEIGPGLSKTLIVQVARRRTMEDGDRHDALLFVMPVRVRKHDHGRWEGNGAGEAFDRNTVSRDWHKAALQDANLRDMPLRATAYGRGGVARGR
jgi:integrase